MGKISAPCLFFKVKGLAPAGPRQSKELRYHLAQEPVGCSTHIPYGRWNNHAAQTLKWSGTARVDPYSGESPYSTLLWVEP